MRTPVNEQNFLAANGLAWVSDLVKVEGGPPGMIALAFTGTHVRQLRGSEEVSMPHLQGISGCGIWRAWEADDPRPGRWSQSMIRLVGIEHRVVRGEPTTIRGTLIGYVVNLIVRAVPELRAAVLVSHGTR
jgi:hypothetical protein